ncbi:LPXTG-motif cell wall anchor domain protein [Bifidobacterium saguini DSM 23967]|uniref:LPXTG-motif cell wall anchor domain protein n=2 Tax=Bifidobacterium saguini TaxID=762210 RepID=A0A087D400_9BIFI|nr:isopeptide-forming domain-containing fimbrial protein [Bifidobacterium saguini]KFI90250.1 LPXTG-motif cell wall anchor domain protein [Bifidobacterium saguini DSM 23967]QTB90702.1 isopeptide-forming domain-containing fimbrial protein [Bifidobacterium saguini]
MRDKRIIGSLAAVAAAITVAASTAAFAFAAPAQATTEQLREPQPITVTSSADISGKTLKAVRLAGYSAASIDGQAIGGLDVNDAGHASSIANALKDSGATGYDADNPMAWVVQNLLDSQSSPYAGSLRTLVTRLAKDTAITGDSTATALAKGADANTMTATVTPGIYLILDLTANGQGASIPMIAATGIDGITTLGTGQTTQTLGTVEYKPNDATVTKRIVQNGAEALSNTAAIGETVHYRLTTSVPNHTGYEHFRLTLTDTLDQGLAFQRITAVTVNGKTLDAALWHASDPTAAQDGTTTFTVTFAPTADGTSDLLASDSTRNAFPIGSGVTVEYDALLTKDAAVNTTAGGTGNHNTVNVSYSHNPNDWTDQATVPGDTTTTYTGRFTLSKTDMDGKPLAAATFAITRNGSDTPVSLAAISAGDATHPAEYRTATAGETSTTLITIPASGKAVIQGLDGEYTVTERSSPFNTSPLPEFTLTVEPDHGQNHANAVTDFQQDPNKLATLDGTTATVTVRNARSILQLPKTGSTWMTIWIAAGTLSALGGLLLLRKRD